MVSDEINSECGGCSAIWILKNVNHFFGHKYAHNNHYRVHNLSTMLLFFYGIPPNDTRLASINILQFLPF